MGEVPERDALIVARGRREVQEIARTPSGGEDGVAQSRERAERRRPAIPVGLGVGEGPRVAEGRIEIERVETDRGRQQQHGRQAAERTGVASTPEQHDECGHEREPEEASPGRETSEHPGRDGFPACRGQKGSRRKGEEEAVGVQRREDEADRVEREVEDDVVRAAAAQDRPRDLRQRPGGHRPAPLQMSAPATSVEPVTQASACAAAG